MKIKDKISGEIYEADTWRSWNGVVQYVKKGTNGPIRSGDDVEIIEEDKPKDATDWATFRREAAKDILCAIVSHDGFNYHDPDQFTADAIAASVGMAGALIQKLKEEQK